MSFFRNPFRETPISRADLARDNTPGSARRDETPSVYAWYVGSGSTKVQALDQGQTQGQDQVHADEQVRA